jgi:hypothetical protein
MTLPIVTYKHAMIGDRCVQRMGRDTCQCVVSATNERACPLLLT